MTGPALQGDFTGMVVLVTGASSGIGAAVSSRFVEAGASVAACDISGTRPKGSAFWGQVDVSDESMVDGYVADLLAEFGRIDVVANVAGVGVQSDRLVLTHEVSTPDWRRVLDVNLTGSFLVARAALPALVESKGVIVNIASVYGLASAPGIIAYTASKHGVVGLTQGMALEYAEAGVRVVAICPGFTMTPMMQNHVRQSGDPAAELARIGGIHPMGRPAEPSEIADAVFWAASGSAGFVTGAAIPVDGGLLAH